MFQTNCWSCIRGISSSDSGYLHHCYRRDEKNVYEAEAHVHVSAARFLT